MARQGVVASLPVRKTSQRLNKRDRELLRATLHDEEAAIRAILAISFRIVVGDEKLEHVLARANLDHVDPSITTANYPREQKGKIAYDAYLIPFDYEYSHAEALRRLGAWGFDPGSVYALAILQSRLEFRALYERSEPFSILAIGSRRLTIDGYVDVPGFVLKDGYRDLIACNGDVEFQPGTFCLGTRRCP